MTGDSLSALRGLRLLLAEDDAATRESLKRQLELKCREVLVAADGREALALFAAERPHIVLLDIAMPGASGLEVAGSLRAADADLPIVMLTCHSDPALMQAAVRLRLMDYLLKPVGLTALWEALERCLACMHRRARLDNGGAVVNLATGQVTHAGERHVLSANERRFLERLVHHRGVMLEPTRLCVAMAVDMEPAADCVPRSGRRRWRARAILATGCGDPMRPARGDAERNLCR